MAASAPSEFTGTSTRRTTGLALGIVALCSAYLLVQVIYALRLPLVMDEFNFARVVHQLRNHVPYRDYTPVKTVLGFYTQLSMLFISSDPWTGLILIKVEMAVINTVILGLTAFLLARDLRPGAILLGLALLFAMSTFLERSSALRVDMMTALCGLVSLVCLLRGWPVRAGVFCTLSFLVSQKGAYYVLAADAALVVWVVVCPRKAVWEFLIFNATMLLVLIVYLAFWGCFSSFSKVFKDVFLQQSHFIIAFKATSLGVRKYWLQTLRRNPMYYGLAAASLVLLAYGLIRSVPSKTYQDPARRSDWLLLPYGVVLTALCLWHRAPWPYFFVILIPTLFVLHVALFDRALRWEAARENPWVRKSFWIVVIVLGIAYPLTRVPKVLQRDNGLQRHMVTLGDSILKPGEMYVDGIGMLYTKLQPVPELAWLDGINIYALTHMDDAQVMEILSELEKKPVKLLILSYRLRDIPRPLQIHFANTFSPLWANLFIYAPRVYPQQERFYLKFSGTYRVEFQDTTSIQFDGAEMTSGTVLELEKGIHRCVARVPARFHFVPDDLEKTADPKYRERGILFVAPYTY